ncbi:Vps5 C terminal like-domain-containing protein [Peziza echinospora]|nr:Vps5 C terminal like-domain-containing protein [Peziza echinospora]
MTSPPLPNLDLETDSPWGDERSINTGSPSAIGIPHSELEAGFGHPSGASAIGSAETATSPVPVSKPLASKSRTPRRPGQAGVIKLEALDDELGPLGPLGDNFLSPEPSPAIPYDQPPKPPHKEPASKGRSRQAYRGDSVLDQVSLEDDEDEDSAARRHGKPPPPVDGSLSGAGGARAVPPSVPVELAANPTFEISVGDPHKVGDLTSAHIVYSVRTKTSSKAYRLPEFTVTRRYRDFLWLYTSLVNNNPGVVVPPPPEKQAVGRFDNNFVESRRAALERMVTKTAAHPVLQHDGDLKLFLESEAFNVDIKHKEKQTAPVTESKGMFGSLGFGSSLTTKFIENDEYFHDRKQYLDALENQLKALLKAVDTVVLQRKALSDAAGDFASSLSALATVELSRNLSSPLESLSDLQIRIKELHDRQAQQDVLTLGITIDEYIRIIGSAKLAFQQRQKAFHTWHAAESEFSKKRQSMEKIQRQGKTQQDRLSQMSAEVAEAERKVNQARVAFEEMGRLMKNELDRFEKEKVEDFKSGVETFLESSVEAQKELIEIWETYLLQMDREEDEALAFQPAPAAAAPSQAAQPLSPQLE